ncbi:N utilization substance protein B [Bacteroidota bacterium]|nr:N utilization substance protein B [Bacteroidota bacterium]
MLLSRRNVRVKVMQVLYTHEQSPDIPFTTLEKSLRERINNSFRLLIYNLYLIEKTAEYSVEDAGHKSSKHLPTEADKKFSVRIFHNPIIQKLVLDENFKRIIREQKLTYLPDADYFRTWFKTLEDTSSYKNYIQNENPPIEEDKRLILYLYRKVLLLSELFTQHVEDSFTTWNDDSTIIENQLVILIDKIATQVEKEIVKGNEKFIKFPESMNEEHDFANELLNRVYYNEEYLATLITPKLENWDKERLAQIDLMLMKMALAELLYFPNIPIKATMNEYIDIAKNYSTPKSGEFINGILDKIMKELKEQGLLKKEGRGLIEN